MLVPFAPSNKPIEPVQYKCHIHRYTYYQNFTTTKYISKIQKACIIVLNCTTYHKVVRRITN